ncbi:unnamed protein product, partial [Brassica rapa]
LCVLNRQPTWAKITQTVHGKGQRAESKDQPTDILCVLTDTHGQPQTSCTDTHRHTLTATDVLCVLTDTHGHSHGRPVCAHGHTQTHTDSHGRPLCADGHTRTSSTDVLCVVTDIHGRPVCTEQTAHVGQKSPEHPRGPKSPKQSTGRASVLSPMTSVLICVLMDSNRRPKCADGHTGTYTDSHGHPVCADGQPRTATDVLPRGSKSPKQSTGRASVMSPRTNVLICVLLDSHRRPVCADGHTRTATDVLCVLTDTHRRPVCADRHTRTSCVC